MTVHWLRTFRLLSQNLSLRAGLYCSGAVAVALLAVTASPYVPDEMAELLGGGAVDHILTILASSMLAVVTFSLSTLIASYAVAGSSAPSRATSLIMRDKSAQNALSTFLGAFIFSIVALVALSTKYYGPKGRVILFFITILVLGAVIWTIIRWIGQLSGMGQLSNVITQIEKTAGDSIENQSHYFVTAEPQHLESPQDAEVLCGDRTGFIQNIDLQRLSKLTEENDLEIWLKVHAGRFVFPEMELAKFQLRNPKSAERDSVIEELLSCFLVGDRRTFEDDPRFGFIVLSEIASRALSPSINDPGTAIEIIGSQVRLISKIHSAYGKRFRSPWSQRLHLWPVTPADLIDDAFQAISRDGAAFVEVNIFLHKALSAIYQYPEFQNAAHKRAQISLEQSEKALTNQHDIQRLRRFSLS